MPIPLQRIIHPVLNEKGLRLHVLRLDMTHPHISGNKWYKLKYNLEEAQRQRKDTLITFGGAYSNHIAATAAAGKEYGFRTVGIIRGEELSSGDNPTLRFASKCGMELRFVSREDYRQKENSPFLRSVIQSFAQSYLIPEGGTNEFAVKGCMEIPSLVEVPFDYISAPCGTGGTLSGITLSLKKHQQAIGFSVLKAPGYHKEEIVKWISHFQITTSSNFQITEDYHFGGYGKYNRSLLSFIHEFENDHGIPLDQVYTGKMMFGIFDLIGKGYFEKNSTIIAVHTGGLQGKLH